MSMQYRALVVDDEASSRLNIRDLLSMEHFEVEEASNGVEALDRLHQQRFDIILLDIRMPKMDGLTALREIRVIQPHVPVIMFTAFGTSDRAIEAIKLGAFDYITKPFDVDELLAVIHRALDYKKLSAEVQTLRDRLAEIEPGEYRPGLIVSKSPVMQSIFKLIGKVAPSDATVLIEGETGTGKEVIANAIWYHSHRHERPFIKVNCAAIPEGLLESELFGHEKGSFTSAHAQQQGRSELANGGTIFLDEIAEMSPRLQSKLLRVIEQGEFQRVGGKRTLHADVRILAATNCHLEEEVRSGHFRKDLYYRLQVVHIILPPLSERKEDIPPLIEYFLRKYGGKRELKATKEVIQTLQQYSLPGNVRELENIIERATVLSQGKHITLEHLALPLGFSPRIGTPAAVDDMMVSAGLRKTLKSVERNLILSALQKTAWNKSQAAKLLKISRRLLLTKISAYNLKP